MAQDKLILMYHGIVKGDTVYPKEREVGAELYDVPVNDFKKHLKIIEDSTLKVKKIEDACENDVVITFDDGEMNNYKLAMPLLKDKQFPAYFFIITKRVGRPGYMGIEELKQMIESGMIIGSHGMSHEILTNLKDTQVQQELEASKTFLERNLGVKIFDLSIPRGFCNDKIINMAYDAGYKNVFISERPKDLTNQQCLVRVAVKSDWNLKRFECALKNQVPAGEVVFDRIKSATKLVFRENGYNWLRSTYIKIFK